MTEPRPAFTHKPPKHGLVGPFSGRQLLAAILSIALAAVVLVAVTTPLGSAGGGPGPVDPRATPFVLGSAPPGALKAGAIPPEFTIPFPDGTTYQLKDLDGRPIRLADLRGKVVWLNFFASWCPPCQQETPILRDLSERYRDRGLEVVGVSVQETSVDDVATYAKRYQLPYTIGFDGSGDVFRAYKLYLLPTQFVIGPDGRIAAVINGPTDAAGASALVESLLSLGTPPASSPSSPIPNASPTP